MILLDVFLRAINGVGKVFFCKPVYFINEDSHNLFIVMYQVIFRIDLLQGAKCYLTELYNLLPTLYIEYLVFQILSFERKSIHKK